MTISETEELIAEYTKFYEGELDISSKDMSFKEDVYVARWEKFNSFGAPNIDRKIKEKLRILKVNTK